MLRSQFILALLMLAGLNSARADGDCVVLLHGMARGAGSMAGLQERLEAARFSVVNIDYPDRRGTIASLAEQAVEEGLRQCEEKNPQRINFVTHSLGGILVRYYFALQHHPRLHRVVMLGPPNNGSEVVDLLRNMPGYTLFTGLVGTELGTDGNSVPLNLPPVEFELGVIAGTVSLNPLFDLVVPDPNDGTVSVASTRVEGMRDHIVLPVSHTLMMYNNAVKDNVVHFLVTGEFLEEQPPP